MKDDGRDDDIRRAVLELKLEAAMMRNVSGYLLAKLAGMDGDPRGRLAILTGELMAAATFDFPEVAAPTVRHCLDQVCEVAEILVHGPTPGE